MSEQDSNDEVTSVPGDFQENPSNSEARHDSAGDSFVAPHPGVQGMPSWKTGELIDVPRKESRNWLMLIGPGLVMGASAIGGGEWLVGPLVTAKYGGALMWLAGISILAQGLYNLEVSRYTLYTGEPIFTGKFRTSPGPWFWLPVYFALDLGSFFPYLAAAAATPVAVLLLQGELPNPGENESHWYLVKWISTGIFLGATIPLIFGGKVYNSLKAVMSFKLVVVFGFLMFLAIFYSSSSTWIEICSGFFKFGTVPVQMDEDRNGNGVLDPGEDWDADGHLDEVEPLLAKTVDSDGDGKPDDWEKDAAGKPIKFDDRDKDGIRDGTNVENLFVSLWSKGTLPDIDYSLIALIAALAAIAGNGGLSNTPVSNFARDQGWGMGHHVGAIPSMVGGGGITLSHTGTVFRADEDSLPRWKRWYQYVARDQMFVWVPACFLGVALPSMLSVEFLQRGTEADKWNTAALTANGVGNCVADPPDHVLMSITGLSNVFSGETVGNVFWGLTLFCGFIVLGPSMVTTIDGILRRWIDVLWTALPALREYDTSFIKHLYFRMLVLYSVIGTFMIWANEPVVLLKIATLLFNFALGFSCFHTIVVNTRLLPPKLRPNWFICGGMLLSGCFFTLLGVVSAIPTLREMGLLAEVEL